MDAAAALGPVVDAAQRHALARRRARRTRRHAGVERRPGAVARVARSTGRPGDPPVGHDRRRSARHVERIHPRRQPAARDRRRGRRMADRAGDRRHRHEAITGPDGIGPRGPDAGRPPRQPARAGHDGRAGPARCGYRTTHRRCHRLGIARRRPHRVAHRHATAQRAAGVRRHRLRHEAGQRQGARHDCRPVGGVDRVAGRSAPGRLAGGRCDDLRPPATTGRRRIGLGQRPVGRRPVVRPSRGAASTRAQRADCRSGEPDPAGRPSRSERPVRPRPRHVHREGHGPEPHRWAVAAIDRGRRIAGPDPRAHRPRARRQRYREESDRHRPARHGRPVMGWRRSRRPARHDAGGRRIADGRRPHARLLGDGQGHRATRAVRRVHAGRESGPDRHPSADRPTAASAARTSDRLDGGRRHRARRSLHPVDPCGDARSAATGWRHRHDADPADGAGGNPLREPGHRHQADRPGPRRRRASDLGVAGAAGRRRAGLRASPARCPASIRSSRSSRPKRPASRAGRPSTAGST